MYQEQNFRMEQKRQTEIGSENDFANYINFYLRAHARTIELTKSDFLEKTLPDISV